MAKKSASTRRARTRASPKAKKRVASNKSATEPVMDFKNPKDKALWTKFQEAQKKLERLLSADLEKLFSQGVPDELVVRRSVFVISAPPALKKSRKTPGKRKSTRRKKSKQ